MTTARTSAAPWRAPSLADFTEGRWSDLSAAEQRRVAGHFAYAQATVSRFTDLKLPYREPATGAVNLAAVRAILAVLGGARGGVSGVPATERARIRAQMQRLLPDPAGGARKDLTGDVHVATAIGSAPERPPLAYRGDTVFCLRQQRWGKVETLARAAGAAGYVYGVRLMNGLGVVAREADMIG